MNSECHYWLHHSSFTHYWSPGSFWASRIAVGFFSAEIEANIKAEERSEEALIQTYKKMLPGDTMRDHQPAAGIPPILSLLLLHCAQGRTKSEFTLLFLLKRQKHTFHLRKWAFSLAQNSKKGFVTRSIPCFYDITVPSPTSSHQTREQSTYRLRAEVSGKSQGASEIVCGDDYLGHLTCEGPVEDHVLWQTDLTAYKPLLHGVTWKNLPRWMEGRWVEKVPGELKKDQQSWQVTLSLHKQKFVLQMHSS